MFPTLGIFANAAVVVIGLLWCREMFRRWRRDLAELRSSDDFGGRTAIVILWVATALIVVFLINFSVGVLKGVQAASVEDMSTVGSLIDLFPAPPFHTIPAVSRHAKPGNAQIHDPKRSSTSAGLISSRLPSARFLTSTFPSASPFGPTNICQGMPIRSAVANFAPGRWSRSS